MLECEQSVSSDGMEREDEGQGPEWPVVERHRKKRNHDTESSGASSKECIKRANVGSNSRDVLEWKMVIVFDETKGSHIHTIRLTNAIENMYCSIVVLSSQSPQVNSTMA